MDAYYEIIKRHTDYVTNSKEMLKEFEDLIQTERTQWKKAVSSEKHKMRFGFFVGPGYSSGGFEVVVGAGLLIPVF